MSNQTIAWLRTIVPTLWSAGVAWLILRIPGLSPIAGPLAGLGTILAVPLVLAAWKALVGAIEPHLPPWLAAVLLGSAAMPTYRYPQPAPQPPTPSVTVT